MFPWLMLWTWSRERALGGGPREPLGTVQACLGIQQAPCTLRGFGDPADLRSRWELTLRLEMSSQSLPAMHLGPSLWPKRPLLPKDTGSGDSSSRARPRVRRSPGEGTY